MFSRKKKPSLIDGDCHKAYEAVRDAFKKNFTDGWESEGASFAVYKNGKLIVDLWGGFADKQYDRPWREDTLSTVFSISKSLSAICVAMLVDRGLCDYDDFVVKYWPEFGKHGKETITIRMILEHRAGLPYLENMVTKEAMDSPDVMDRILENEKPKYTPGKHTAYHPMTIGWLLNGVFRRIDPKKRTIGEFFREEISDKFDTDVYIGNCQSEEFRVAKLTGFGTKQLIREIAYDKMIAMNGFNIQNPKGNFSRSLYNCNNWGMKLMDMHNNPEVRTHPQPAANGIGNGRGLAKTYQILIDGSLVGPKVLKKLAAPNREDDLDHSWAEKQSKGIGFQFWKSPTGSWQFGHPGMGGQMVKADQKNGLVFAYVCNGMKAGIGAHCCTFAKLEKALYECFEKETQNSK